MKAKAIFCETCQICIVNNDGITVRSAQSFEKDKIQIHICIECCQAKKDQSFEESGFIHSGLKMTLYTFNK